MLNFACLKEYSNGFSFPGTTINLPACIDFCPIVIVRSKGRQCTFKILLYCSCFNVPTLRASAVQKKREVHPDLNADVVLLKSNLAPECRHTLNLDAVGRTVNDGFSLKITPFHFSLVHLICFNRHCFPLRIFF